MGLFSKSAAAETIGPAVRGMSFGDRWINVVSTGADRTHLDQLTNSRPRTTPKTVRCDPVVLSRTAVGVAVSVDGIRVGQLHADTASQYAPILDWVGQPVATAGVILIDAEGHPGNHLKLFAPQPALLVPANSPLPGITLWPALDRAGGITLARKKADRDLLDAATHGWDLGAAGERSIWLVVTRTEDQLDAALNGQPLPALTAARTGELCRQWDRHHHGETTLQMEAILYTIKSGKQINLRFALN